MSARMLWIVGGLALVILGFQGKLGTALAAILSPGDVEIGEASATVPVPDNSNGGSGGGSFD